MKQIKTIIVIIAVFAVALSSWVGQALPVSGDSRYFPAAGGGTTNAATTLSWVIIPVGAGTPVVKYINATSDKGASVVQFYSVDAFALATHTNSTTTLYVNTTNSIDDAGSILIRHMSNETYEKRSLSASTGSTNLVLTAAPLQETVPGDAVYHITKTGAGKIPVGVTTLSLYGDNLYAGQANYPLYAEVDGGTNATLNTLSVTFVK
jgi:hypothetical protein